MLWGWLDALIDCWTCLGESELHVYGESKLHVYVSMFMGRVNYMCMCTCVWGEWITCVYVHVYGESELRVYVYMEAKSPSMWVFLVCLWHGVAHWCLWLTCRLDWLASKLQGSHLGSQYCEYTSAPSKSAVWVWVLYTHVSLCVEARSQCCLPQLWSTLFSSVTASPWIWSLPIELTGGRADFLCGD